METNHDRPQIIALDLLSAFRQPGCPLCRIRQQAADRYLFGLLWENMGNMSVRQKLAENLGFCPEHTWQLEHLAASEFAGETGTSILYREIVHHVLNRLRVLEASLPDDPPASRRQKEQVCHRVRAQTPVQSCPVCVDVAAAEERNMHWLIAGCPDPVFRARYAASDGLCLSHLGRVVEEAAITDPNAAHFFVRLAILKGETLIANLDGYVRKRAWEHRLEVIEPDEQNAACRAARFLGGLGEQDKTEIQRQRQTDAISIAGLKEKGLRIDE